MRIIKYAKTEMIPAGNCLNGTHTTSSYIYGHEKIIGGKFLAKGRGEIMTTNYVG